MFAGSGVLTSAERHILLGRGMGETYGDLALKLRVSEETARKLAQRGRESLRARARCGPRR
jgi:DNA-directed RNA polymerase specialized sigma24 family protein